MYTLYRVHKGGIISLARLSIFEPKFQEGLNLNPLQRESNKAHHSQTTVTYKKLKKKSARK